MRLTFSLWWKELRWVKISRLEAKRGFHQRSVIEGDKNAKEVKLWFVKLLECFGIFWWPTTVVFQIEELHPLLPDQRIYPAVMSKDGNSIWRSPRSVARDNGSGSRKFALRVGPNKTAFCAVLTERSDDVPVRLAHISFVGYKKRRELKGIPLY